MPETPLRDPLRELRHHTFTSMGTVVSLTCHDDLAGRLAAVRAAFDRLDRRFSLYRADSEATRFNARGLLLADASQEFRDAYWMAHDWGMRTGAAFTAHRPDGDVDLSGIVKAIALEEAATILGDQDPWCLNAGGDITVNGHDPALGPEGWLVGIEHPCDMSRLISQAWLGTGRPAMATSGTGRRGEHIWRLTPSTLIQVSVVADDIVTADVLATALLSGGESMLEAAPERYGVELLAVRADGVSWASPVFRAAVA